MDILSASVLIEKGVVDWYLRVVELKVGGYNISIVTTQRYRPKR